ncbi:S1/P1 nuclease [Pareuzebyella sediminis]|uniref:S1/P1 nuclease n=1 Tax=Pareuzebyella sediminis TaxID=2607998 RepID=UPI0011ECD2D6|nr:S1/P1 nuclease [Pareuzebyella sediminis]
MKNIILILFLITNLTSANNVVWSKTGHRVIGEIAEEYLTKRAKRAIDKLLNGQSLASVANFADEIKADSTYRKFSAWHYVNFPAESKYTEVEPSAYGDLITGIQKCIAIIKNRASSDQEKTFYLKMLIHLVGDLHQPMHVGRLEDKGGNDIQVQWFNRGSNLHKIWDANMIDDYGMSYTELAASLPKLSNSQLEIIEKGDILDWVEESQDIANKLYDSVEVGEKLYYRYSYVWWDTVELQLQKGGIRLAKVLNDLF